MTARAELDHHLPVNIIDYGADRNGNTDSTQQILAAFAAASTTSSVAAGGYANGGSQVVAPAGEYLIDAALRIPDRVDLAGAGTTLTAFICTNASAGFTVGPVPTVGGVNGSRGGLTHGFTIDGNATTTGPLFRINVAVQRSFKNIRVYNSLSDGAWIYGAQNCSFEQFNCESNGDPLTNLGSSLVLDAGAGNNTFVKCEIADGSEYDMKIVQTTAQLHGTGTSPNQNTFLRCLFERVNQGQAGITYLGSGDSNTFEDCHFQGPFTQATSLTKIRHDNAHSDLSTRWRFHNCHWQGSQTYTTALDISGSIPSVYFSGSNVLQNHLVGVKSDAASGLVGLDSIHYSGNNVSTPFMLQ